MSQKNTNSDKSVKVLSDAREHELLTLMSHLHGKVLTCLQEVGVAPKFNDNFAKCTNEDYKALHEQSRILIRDKGRARWESYIGSIQAKINVVVETYMVKARATKAQLDALRANTPEDMRAFLPSFPNTVKVPVSDLVGCWAAGTDISRIVAELDKLFPRQVAKGKDDSYFLTVAFQAEEKVAPAPTQEQSSAQEPTSETKGEEEAPKSEEQGAEAPKADIAAAAE